MGPDSLPGLSGALGQRLRRASSGGEGPRAHAATAALGRAQGAGGVKRIGALILPHSEVGPSSPEWSPSSQVYGSYQQLVRRLHFLEGVEA